MNKLSIKQKLFMIWIMLIGLCAGITLGSYVKIHNLKNPQPRNTQNGQFVSRRLKTAEKTWKSYNPGIIRPEGDKSQGQRIEDEITPPRGRSV